MRGANQTLLRLGAPGSVFRHRTDRLCLRKGSRLVARFKERQVEEQTDLYALLELSPDCDAEQIKAQYRTMQKRCHPDVSGNEELSAQLNDAYAILSDPALKAQYDQRLSTYRIRHKGELRRPASKQHGVVGPVDSGSVLAREIVKMDEGSDYIMEGRKLVVWLREWGKTFLFAAELPLPMPVQCDDIEDGVRLAVIDQRDNVIKTIGEILFTVHLLDDKTGWTVEARRICNARGFPMPGESRLMNAFLDAMRDRSHAGSRKNNSPIMLSGIAAAVFAQLMPALIPIPTGNPEGSSYEGYHLEHSLEDADWDS